ncbi:hypothetical protein H0H92_004738 [Tricholoma furcatifolium]|nr:hypothetical protein H0H92_004738 [Tricholoma furcatifolium]
MRTSTSSTDPSSGSTTYDDDKELVALGYKPSFKREFSNLATGLCSSIATTFNTPLLLGGPASVGRVPFIYVTILLNGAGDMVLDLGGNIMLHSWIKYCGNRERVSYMWWPIHSIRSTYTKKIPCKGQIAGVSSTEFGLANMIWAAVIAGKDGNYAVSQGQVVGLFCALLIVHGILNSLATRQLAFLARGFVFVNLGTTFLIIIVLLATTPRSEMHPASYVFGSDGIVNQTGGWNTGIAFLFGLLSVQWTMTDYDATAHISEEVRRAAYAAPSAIFIAVIGTGLIGWLLNIVVVLCSGPLANLPGPTGSAFLEIMILRMGKDGALVLWTFVCLTAFFVVQTALQAVTRTTMLPGLLDLASPVAANAIFSLTAMALDSSYIIPIFLRRVYQNHPEVMFKPGPFYMGDGLLGKFCNATCILWTIFVCLIFSFPNYKPVTKENMNYASVITIGVLILSGAAWVLGAHKHYHGPQTNLHQADAVSTSVDDEVKDEKDANAVDVAEV